MHLFKVALLGLALSTGPTLANDWIDTGSELIRIVREGQTVCRIWVIIPGQSIGFSLQDAHLDVVVYELTALRAGSVYITTDPDLVVLRGVCEIPTGLAIQRMPPPWPTPPAP
jgi:hypothetical protein